MASASTDPAPAAGAAGGASTPGKKFEIKKWNAVALWSWDLDVDMCAICRNNIMEPCIECQAKSADEQTGECSVAWGGCGVSYPSSQVHNNDVVVFLCFSCMYYSTHSITTVLISG